jgi:hypothetical protein
LQVPTKEESGKRSVTSQRGIIIQVHNQE